MAGVGPDTVARRGKTGPVPKPYLFEGGLKFGLCHTYIQ